MHDKRLTTRLINYWDALRKERAVPEMNWFNTAAIEDVWQFCFRLRVEPGSGAKRHYNYEFMGTEIIAAYGRDLTGITINSSSNTFPGAKIVRKADELVTLPAPITEEGQFINDASKVVKFRSCLLPFGTVEKNITHIIGGVSWRSF